MTKPTEKTPLLSTSKKPMPTQHTIQDFILINLINMIKTLRATHDDEQINLLTQKIRGVLHCAYTQQGMSRTDLMSQVTKNDIVFLKAYGISIEVEEISNHYLKI